MLDILVFVPIYDLLFFFIFHFSFPPAALCLLPSQSSYDLFCPSPMNLVGFRSPIPRSRGAPHARKIINAMDAPGPAGVPMCCDHDKTLCIYVNLSD